MVSLFPGYANEVGEAFRSVAPKIFVHASYCLAFAYVFGDAGDKAIKAHRAEKATSNYSVAKVAKVGFDALAWQSLASVIIPGFVINRICAFSYFALCRLKARKDVAKWTTTAIGLSSIPFIIHPIDTGVDIAFDKTIRPLLGIPPKYKD
ncbi:UNVERIFIED_CONTAM: hypothetical protein PYX00_003156 [Menopon gallinae]|uniref:Mitochondrial fission process protein 1 n=1 Tax=Menopon gallinae TaxID=328185 RepID=A0AAW2I0G1_9NEOP